MAKVLMVVYEPLSVFSKSEKGDDNAILVFKF